MIKDMTTEKNKFTNFLLDNGIIVGLVLLGVILSFTSPYFLTTRNLINVLRQVSINGLLSIGMTYVILTGGIDLSVGSLLSFGGIIAASFASASFGGGSSPAFVSIFLGLLVGAALGAVNGVFISKWKIPPFVVTLGMLSVARGFTYIYSDGMPIPNLSKSFIFIGQGTIFGIPVPVIIFALVFAIAWIILYKTRFGRYIYAVGGNINSAKISGINTKWIIFSVYVISGLLSSLGGLILTARTTAGLPQAGNSYELNAIGAVVIGGTSLKGGQGSLVGTLLGVLIIGVINNGLDLLGVSSYYQQVIKGAIIVGAVLINHMKDRSN
ncbi:ABC transporter permease [Halocella sp. SP3-1]|uniref:ABC transporter permease n=1 Tax=Halocella sp. SP3-1 TaxID=2382161 RepID=UPI000F7655AE|nr:ABC transporter permease [Halocella sp. SP3-1]AZO93289.1 ABC transporter permease [Halocella sp. SP3-1]